MVPADLADPASLSSALDQVEQSFGRLDGAIHAAGVVDDRLLEMAEPADHKYVLDAKAGGALALAGAGGGDVEKVPAGA